MKKIYTSKAPEPIGPYSQAIAVNDMLYVSGQIPLDAASGEINSGDIQEQTELVLRNLQSVVGAAGGRMTDVVKTTIYLRDMSDFAAVNEVYGRYFSSDPAPARATVEVSRLPKDVGVEIDAVAWLRAATKGTDSSGQGGQGGQTPPSPMAIE